MQGARGNDHGAAKRVPDEHHGLRAAIRQIGDPGHDIQRTFGQDVGMTVPQPQGGDPVPTQHVREPGIGAVARPAESPPGATHPDHPVLRLRGLMQDRLDVAPVRPEQHPLSQLTFVGWAGTHVVDADGEGMRVFLARLVVRGLWHVTHPPGAWRRRGRARPPSLGAGERWTRRSRYSGEQRKQGRYSSICTGKAWTDVMIIQRHAAINSLLQTRVSARKQRRIDEDREKVLSEKSI